MGEELDNIKRIMDLTYAKKIYAFDDVFLSRTLEKKLKEKKLSGLTEYCNLLQSDALEAETLYNSLYNNFSIFFRDVITFAFLEHSILPLIISEKTKGGEIRIWSAGCAEGQEPYSLAILLDDISESYNREVRFRIFATDISQKTLEKAKRGLYREWAIQNVKKKHLDKYFRQNGASYEIIPEIKKHIQFSEYNLLDSTTTNPPDSIYGGFDIIVCSNLCIYYREDFYKLIVNKFQNSLINGGYFVTSEVEKTLFQRILNSSPMESAIPIFINRKKEQTV